MKYKVMNESLSPTGISTRRHFRSTWIGNKSFERNKEPQVLTILVGMKVGLRHHSILLDEREGSLHCFVSYDTITLHLSILYSIL